VSGHERIRTGFAVHQVNAQHHGQAGSNSHFENHDKLEVWEMAS
jgi:hypothetical protein